MIFHLNDHAARIAMDYTKTYGFCPMLISEHGAILLNIYDGVDLAKKAEPMIRSHIKRLQKKAKSKAARGLP